MKLIIGSPARNDQFFSRPDIRNNILEAIDAGENLLITAPRRAGKTSILLDLVDNPDPNIFAVFVDTEAVDNPDDYFKLLLESILNADRIEGFGKFSKNVKSKLTEWASKIAGFKIAGIGVELNQGDKINYFDQLKDFLSTIKLEGKILAVLVDEFPITLEHIFKKHGLDTVVHFLNQNRTLRQNPVFHSKIKFIYSGSIGLFTVVKRFQATDRINDLREIKITALRKPEAIEFVNELLSQKTGQKPDNSIMDYILYKIEWWIPFYFQLLVKEISDLIVSDDKKLSKKIVDLAFENVVKNGNIYFEHSKSRLYKIFNKNSLEFVTELLIELKNKNLLDYNDIINIAEGHSIRKQLDEILEILKYDGYIIEENNSFKFYSPIIKKWWK